MDRSRFLLALLMVNLAAFVMIVVFLPKPSGAYSYTNAVDHFFASRARWDIAWGVLISNLLLSGGVYLAVTAFYPTRKD